MITITTKTNCCGCGACVQACNLNCITMATDAEGFLYPQIDKASCIRCGACIRACPILNRGEKTDGEKLAYVLRCNDEEVRLRSSSGGIFSILAERVLANGGAVFGAAFAADFSVHHIMIEHVNDLPRLSGSKYIQSRIEDSYQQAEKRLKSGRAVLFSGTGCQIAGLKAYLKAEYEMLYTVDLFCHGVPSPAVWKKYLQFQENAYGSPVKAVCFRNKSYGWHQFSMRLQFENEEVYDKVHSEDAFMRLFLKNICLRPSCHDCKFRESRSGSDIMIGDAWGIESWMPEMDDNKGTSIVLVNTDKGRHVYGKLEIQ